MARMHGDRVLRTCARAIAIVAALLLPACSVDGGLAPGLGALTGQDGLISEAQERELGAKEHPRILAAFGGAYNDPAVLAALDKVVSRLGRSSDRPDISYKITVLNSPSVNAFALPGGFLYATRGLLALANDADELAAVLAHEMGHVSARHAAKRQNEALRTIFIGKLANVLRDPSAVTQALSDSESMIASFSRSQELEADEIGVEMAVKAGFDPYGAVTFLESMGRDGDYRARLLGREKDKHRPNLGASHPATAERIRRVVSLSEDLGFEPGKRDRERDAYLAMIDGLLFSDDPSEGYVRGRRFLHPGHRFMFSVPDGYSLQNAQDAVFAIGAEDVALRFDGVEVSSEQSLASYVSSVWGSGAELGKVSELSVNGFPAAIAEARHQGWSYRMAAVQFEPSRVYRFLLAAREVTPKEEREFWEIVTSLRKLSVEEAKSLKPLRVRIVTVRPGEKVADLARRMEDTEFAEDRFRLLNGLADGEEVRPGQKVKLITE